ncbi:MAG: DUF1127 domain-containing protein [Hyphomicrobiales bacterium]|nr:DUF1127 domain-containing protein [Hyphomicrobiales bacterium]
MATTLHPGGMLTAAPAGTGSFRAAAAAFLRTHLVAPVKAWREKNRSLDQVAKMTDQELADLGFSRQSLRWAVEHDRNLRD